MKAYAKNQSHTTFIPYKIYTKAVLLQYNILMRVLCTFLLDDEIRCPHPGIPINGRLTQGENFSVGNFVEFECDPGYVMIGEARQECYYFLEWSD